MIINKKTEEKRLVLSIEGRLDTITAPELERYLDAELGDAETLLLDFDKLEYVSSAGLRVILKAHKTMSRKGGLSLTGVNPTVLEIFEITGFADILTIE